ncbi:hypothetical protein CEXT_412291 [Caerostris extrusa]|uniref:Uncharacterized protein n=1 Tax=Caerostris extrusa TaxID=172846 RepID=A0AAV4R331_CAEEX|nr:hypothetical protein CEXT_412291 [Caerostris extrusa]
MPFKSLSYQCYITSPKSPILTLSMDVRLTRNVSDVTDACIEHGPSRAPNRMMCVERHSMLISEDGCGETVPSITKQSSIAAELPNLISLIHHPPHYADVNQQRVPQLECQLISAHQLVVVCVIVPARQGESYCNQPE